MDRPEAITLARKLKALAEHPSTPPNESSAARERLEALRMKFEPPLSDEELLEPRQMSVDEATEMARKVYDPATGKLDWDALDDLIVNIPDPKARDLMRGISGAGRLVRFFWNRRKK